MSVIPLFCLFVCLLLLLFLVEGTVIGVIILNRVGGRWHHPGSTMSVSKKSFLFESYIVWYFQRFLSQYIK